jgi:SAM-dependent methyltransferase
MISAGFDGAMAGVDALRPLPPEGVELHSPEAAQFFVTEGLSWPETHGRWTDGGMVRVGFRLPRRPPGGVVLWLDSLAYIAAGLVTEQRAAISVNGHRLVPWNIIDPVLRARRLAVPAAALDGSGRVVLELRILTGVHPFRLGLGDDRRYLCLLLGRLSWQEARALVSPDLSAEHGRPVGRESRKSFAAKIDSGFWTRFVTGPAVLDVGFQGDASDDGVVPILPGAIGVDLGYPGYDGRVLPFASDSQDAVYSSHCLEHIADSIKAIQEWHRVVRVGGHIITVVPSGHLYERRRRVPSRWNADHKRVYTPAGLLAEFEAALVPNSYRVRHLMENDAGYQYGLPQTVHAEGCHEIELVIEKIAPPGWSLED